MTIHWIAADWKLRSCLLDFVYFPPPHNQYSTSELILKVLTDFNVHTKVRAITTDSGPEMGPAMNHVRKALKDNYGIDLDGNWHLKCVLPYYESLC